MILNNLDFLVTTSFIYKAFPYLFGLSFSAMYIFGPLFYFYVYSIMDNKFTWKPIYWSHFLPFILYSVHLWQLVGLSGEIKIKIIDRFLLGQSHLDSVSAFMIAFQILHLSLYLYFSGKLIREKTDDYISIPFLISFEKRKTWANSLFYFLSGFVLIFTAWYIVLLINGYYLKEADYINTLATSVIIYFIAYKAVLSPELINPHFQKKYLAPVIISTQENIQYSEKLKVVLENKKVFLNPDLNLELLAKEVDLPPYLVSRIINESFGKSFFELVNHHRIEEVKKRLNDPVYGSLSILGIAMDVGFNSKSSFNTAFRKITGMTPSEFKKQ